MWHHGPWNDCKRRNSKSSYKWEEISKTIKRVDKPIRRRAGQQVCFMISATGWKNDITSIWRNRFQFWKIRWQELVMQWNFYRKNCMFFYFSWTKITSNVWTNQIVWRHSQTWNVKIVPKLFDKSFIAFEIWSPHFENRSEVMPIYFFQPVVLFIMLTWYLTLYH